LALGVLMDTFIVRTILVPCTVILLGRWNWWPSKLSRPDRQLDRETDLTTEPTAQPVTPPTQPSRG